MNCLPYRFSLSVQVTARHIDAGQENCPEACPVALAVIDSLSRQCNEFANVEIGDFRAEVDIAGRYFCAPLSDELVAAIKRFDNTGEFTPINFDLEFSP